MTTTEAALRDALERLHRNFNLLLAGKPVRDVAETDAEVRHALSQPSPASSTAGEDAAKFSREMDRRAWDNADNGQHTRENNIRLARANTAGKAKALFHLLAGWSESDFVRAAASDDGENLLAMLVGVLGEFPNPSLSPLSGEPASVAVEAALRERLQLIARECDRQNSLANIKALALEGLDPSLGGALSKPTPVEAGLREALRLAKEALDLAHPYVADAVKADGGIDTCDIAYRTDLEKVEAASAALSETLPGQEDGA